MYATKFGSALQPCDFFTDESRYLQTNNQAGDNSEKRTFLRWNRVDVVDAGDCQDVEQLRDRVGREKEGRERG